MSEKDLKTSSLLFDQAPLLVRPELAVRLGLNEAILLQQIHYWLENKRNSVKEKDLQHERTYVNGRFWTYDSYVDWQKQFPFWSARTVERIFTSLEDKGILLSDNFNTWKTDRTKWYTIDYDALDTYEGKKPKKKPVKKKEVEKTDTEQSDNLADSENTHSDNLADCGVEQSDNLADSNTPSCGDGTRQVGSIQSDNLWSPIPKTSLDSFSETSDQDFINSSSSLNIDKQSYIEEKRTEEEEEKIKVMFSHLGHQLASEGIMRTNKQIQSTLEIMVERELYIFDKLDVSVAINHYKEECKKRSIGQPPLFFVNGFELKLNQRHSGQIGKSERDARVKPSVSKSELTRPTYNWLDEA